MSSRRVIALFIAAFVVIGLATWLSAGRHGDRAVATGQQVLPDLKKSLNDVTEVGLTRADGTRTTLKKSGAAWLVAEREFAADTGKVRKLLIDLAALEIEEEKTSDPARYAAIGVEGVDVEARPQRAAEQKGPDDFSKPAAATRIDVTAPGRKWALIVGKSSGSKSSYVRLADAKQSFLASPRIDVESEPQRWLDHTIVDIAAARIQSVEVKAVKGASYTASRIKREDENFSVTPIPKGRKLSHEGVANTLANGLESLSQDDVHKKSAPATGATTELASAVYRTFDGLSIEVDGRKESTPGLKKDDPKVEKFFITLAAASKDKATEDEARKLNARVGGREFEISSYKFEGLFKPLDDLLATAGGS